MTADDQGSVVVMYYSSNIISASRHPVHINYPVSEYGSVKGRTHCVLAI